MAAKRFLKVVFNGHFSRRSFQTRARIGTKFWYADVSQSKENNSGSFQSIRLPVPKMVAPLHTFFNLRACIGTKRRIDLLRSKEKIIVGFSSDLTSGFQDGGQKMSESSF